MNILEDIEKEHELFDDAAGSLVNMVESYSANKNDNLRNEIKNLCAFFIKEMIEIHTKKEEYVLFEALKNINLPLDKGPLFFYKLEHEEHLKQLREITRLLDTDKTCDNIKNPLMEIVYTFCGEVWEHIDKENSVLMTEVSERIRGNNLLAMNKSYDQFLEIHASNHNDIAFARLMIQKYKPVTKIPDSIRGDGCMSCRFYGEGCNGIEHEWWTEHEWEDFFERNDRD